MGVSRIPLWWLMLAVPYSGLVLALLWGDIGPLAYIVAVGPSLLATLWARSNGKRGVGILCCVGLASGFLALGMLELLDYVVAHLRGDTLRLGDIGLVGGPLMAIALLSIIGAILGTLVGLMVGLLGSAVGRPAKRSEEEGE